jgi:hypothetical protein
MNDFDTCPACGFTLNCAGCGEPIENIIAQSSLARELAVQDKEIERLKQGFVRIIWEVKAGATDTEVNAICREMLRIEVET